MRSRSRRKASGKRGARTRTTSSGGRRRGWGSAVKTVYDGVLYASKAEARYAMHLDLLKAARQIRGWERQVRWPLSVASMESVYRLLIVATGSEAKARGILDYHKDAFKKVCTIVPDFKVMKKGGGFKIVEVKGFVTPVWRLKRKLFEALHPEVEYVVVTAKETSAL